MPSRRKRLTGSSMERELKLTDVPSRGTCTIVAGCEHHLLSRIERSYFYVLECQDVVGEVKDQTPLLPLTRTLQIVRELGIRVRRTVNTVDGAKTFLISDREVSHLGQLMPFTGGN